MAERIEQPALIITGRLDRLIPWEDTKRIADEAPKGEWVLYEDGTHVCNNLPFVPAARATGWRSGSVGPAGRSRRRADRHRDVGARMAAARGAPACAS